MRLTINDAVDSRSDPICDTEDGTSSQKWRLTASAMDGSIIGHGG